MNIDSHRVFLALGSNLGDKKQHINTAYTKIEERIGDIVSKSAFYMSRPQGFESDNLFVNTVCEVASTLLPEQIHQLLKEIETELGRICSSANGGYADRIIDIDLLLYDNLIIDTPTLTVPHPRMHLRNFVLVPFDEIAPDVSHPVLHKTIAQLKDDIAPQAHKEGLERI